MMTPNIFDYAPGELSQDAFILWLARWADKEFESSNPKLHNISRNFLAALSHASFSNSDIESVSVRAQYKKTDVLIDVTLSAPNATKHLIIIEDKTGTGPRKGQLKEYKRRIQEQLQPGGDYEGRKPHYIYFKTNDHITRKPNLFGFSNFTRQDALDVLDTSASRTIKNNIFIDYLTRLRRMEEESLAYVNMLTSDWGNAQWSGFLMALCQRLGNEHDNFGYVPNAQGGFIGAWFGWTKFAGMTDKEELYIQIGKHSNKPFDMKVRVATPDKENTTKLKNLILPLLQKKLEAAGIECTHKNIRSGKSIAIAKFENIRIPESDDKVGEFAKEIEEIISVINR